MRRSVVVMALLALAAGGADASALSSGLRGHVYQRGGACLEGTDCRGSAAGGATLAFSRASSGATVRMRTHDDGTYRVLLAPGTYRVKLVGAGLQARVAPSLMSVQQGRMKTVDFVVVAPHVP
jgi:Carboxypeptidase regulatory-like domain